MPGIVFIDITCLLLTYSTSRQTGDWTPGLGHGLLCAHSTACDIISSPTQYNGAPQGDLQNEKGGLMFPGKGTHALQLYRWGGSSMREHPQDKHDVHCTAMGF